MLDTPEMRRVRETQRIISGVRFWLPLLKYSLFTSVLSVGSVKTGDLFTLVHFMSFVYIDNVYNLLLLWFRQLQTPFFHDSPVSR